MSDVNLAPQKKKGKAAGAHRAADPGVHRAEGDPLSHGGLGDPLAGGGHGLHRAAAPGAGKKGKKKAAAAGHA